MSACKTPSMRGETLTAQRLDTGSLLLDGPGVFVCAAGKQKSDYCLCTFNVWAATTRACDADHLLAARASGNQDLHRFLAIASTRPLHRCSWRA